MERSRVILRGSPPEDEKGIFWWIIKAEEAEYGE